MSSQIWSDSKQRTYCVGGPVENNTSWKTYCKGRENVLMKVKKKIDFVAGNNICQANWAAGMQPENRIPQ